MTRVLVFEYLSACGPPGWRAEPAPAAGADAEGQQGLQGMPASPAQELLEQGLTMRDAMVADLLRPPPEARGLLPQGLQVHVACSQPEAGVDDLEGGPAGPPPGARPCWVPAGTDPVRWLAGQASHFDIVWAVAPETGGLLAGCCAAVPPASWLGCEPAAIALCSRKRATLARLSGHGLYTPLAFATHAGRWVTKPDDGAGAVATQVHARLAAAHATVCRGEPGMTTLEPWVEGEPMSLSLLCTGERCELLAVNRQRITLDGDGFVHFGGVDVDVLPRDDPRWPVLALLSSRIAQAIPGLRGYVGVDLVWHEAPEEADKTSGLAGRRDAGGPVVIEVNPRLTSAYPALAARLSRQGRWLAAELLAPWSLAHAA
jgi:predicted ATP-grasp superfamily ATP-dependent carboligase